MVYDTSRVFNSWKFLPNVKWKKEITCHNKYNFTVKKKNETWISKELSNFHRFAKFQKWLCERKKPIRFQTTAHQITYSIEFFFETFLQRLIWFKTRYQHPTTQWFPRLNITWLTSNTRPTFTCWEPQK